MAPRLILTGFMATGKSTVAALAARRLGWRLLDCDDLMVARAGKPIAKIFEQKGEAHFRQLERDVIAEVSRGAKCPQCGNPLPAVIATGGGALVDDRNFDAMNRCGVIVCLTARTEVIAKRVQRSRNKRPKLLEGGKPLKARIEELMEQRRGAYARARVAVDTSDLTLEQAADKVIDAFVKESRWQHSA
jgi:shikimate kinase